MIKTLYANLRHYHGLGRIQSVKKLWQVMRGQKTVIKKQPTRQGRGQQANKMRELLKQELKISRQMINIETGLPPRFRIWGDEGERLIIAPFKDASTSSMAKALGHVRSYMAWVRATRFIMAGETHEPNGITATLVEKGKAMAAFQPVRKSDEPPGKIEWFKTGECDPVLLAMLPDKDEELTANQEAECQKLFGEGGRFEWKPTVH